MEDKYYAFLKVHVFSIMTCSFALISLVLMFIEDAVPYSFIGATLIFAALYIKPLKDKKSTEE